MAETLGQVLNYVDKVFPNSFDSDFKVGVINNEVAKIWKYMTSTQLYSFDIVDASTSEVQTIYSLPSDMDFDEIKDVLINKSTATVTSTSVFETYKYAGDDDYLTGQQYYNHLGSIGLYSSTQLKSGYHARIKYQERPFVFNSTDTTKQFNLDPDWIDYIKFRTIERVAKSGRNPDVILGNNYAIEAEDIKKRLMANISNKKVKTARSKVSFKDWSW